MARKFYLLLLILLIAAGGVWAYAFWYQPAAPVSETTALDEIKEQVPEDNASLAEDTSSKEAETTETTEAEKVEQEATVLKTGENLILPRETFTPGLDSTKPLIKKAKDLLKQYRIKEATDVFRQAYAEEADQVTEYYLGILSAYLGQRAEAEKYLKEAIALNTHPKTTQYAQNLLNLYSYFDTYQGAKPEFLDALISKELLASGEFEIAVDKLKFVTSSVPDYTDAWVLLGSAYLITGKYDKASQTFNKVLPSERGEVYYWLGLAYYYQNDLSKALASYGQALRKGFKPRSKLYEKRGDIYLERGEYEKAVSEYVLGLRETEAQSNVDLYIRPVWLYNDVLKTPEKGLELATQALAARPENAMAQNLMGWSYLSLQDFPKALEYLNKARELDPNLPAVHLNLGRYYEAVENTTEALVAYNEARTLDPEGAIGKSAAERFLKLSQDGSQ